MTGDEVNRVLKDVHRIVVAANMTVDDAAELHVRALISNAMVAAKKNREQALVVLKAWMDSAIDALSDPDTKMRKARDARPTKH